MAERLGRPAQRAACRLDAAELYVAEQVQRVGRELIRRQVKTETPEAPLPLPVLCVAALKLRRDSRTPTAAGPTERGRHRHSKIAVTMEIYTDMPSAATRAALKGLAQWLGN